MSAKLYATVSAAALLAFGQVAHADTGVSFKARGTPGQGTITIPVLVPGTGWSGALAVPSPVGNPADIGYSDNLLCMWDTPPYQDMNETAADAGVNDHIYGGIWCYHQPTATDVTNNIQNNWSYCEAATDGGSFVTLPITTNPENGHSEAVFELIDSNHSTDGKHEVRARCYATTGQPVVMQGEAPFPVGLTISGISAGVMTVSSSSITSGSFFSPGSDVHGLNIPDGIEITSFGTGNGGNGGGSSPAGTYNINNNTLSIGASQSISVANYPGLIYSSNHGATLRRIIDFVSSATDPTYPCSDSNSGTDYAHPVCTGKKSRDIINGSTTVNVNGLGGGVTCVEGAFTWDVTSGGSPYGTQTGYRWYHIQKMGDAPCPSQNLGQPYFAASGTPFNLNIGSNAANGGRIHIKDINLDASNQAYYHNGTAGFIQSPGGWGQIWWDGGTYVGPGMNSHYTPFGSPGFGGGIITTGGSFSNFHDGPGGLYAQNTTVSKVVSDGYSRTNWIYGGALTYDTEVYGTGTCHNGTTTIDGLSFNAQTTLVVPTITTDYINMSCLPANTRITAINSPSSITVSNAATADASGVSILANGEHPDLYQSSGTTAVRANVIINGLDAGSTTNYAEGVLWDDNTWGGVIINSRIYSPSGVFYGFQTSQKLFNHSQVNNTYVNVGLGVYYRIPNGNVNTDGFFGWNSCNAATVGTPAGVRIVNSPTC